MSTKISLIIPSFKGETHIEPLLRSVLEQSLDRDCFEVLVVVNGSVDSVPEIVDRMFGKATGLNYSLIFDDYASLSNARNVGIQRAAGDWVTWVDVDDWISPNFLEELLDSAQSGVTPLAQVADVDEVSGSIRTSPITTQILEASPGIHAPAKLWRALGFAACKLLSTDLARRRLFDSNLRSGEDVAYFPPFYAENGLKIDNTPAHNGATYFRQIRAGSLSRQDASFDFSVSQRLEVMKHLDRAIPTADEEIASVMRSMMRSQTLFAKRYLDKHPDQLSAVVRAFDNAKLEYVPWNMLAGKTNQLAISYNFLPFADASSTVAAKRIMNSGRQWNVINNDMSKVRAIDRKLHEAVLPYISIQKTIKNTAIFGSWRGIREFCLAGIQMIDEIEAEHGPQVKLYSRSMWPASHYLAALHKLKTPSVQWIAEFSDPLRRDVSGVDRAGQVEDDDLWTQIVEGARQAGFELSSNDSLFVNCEKIAYALADVIYFTNSHQMTYMLSYLNDGKLRERVRRIAKIEPQPAPPDRLLLGPAGTVAKHKSNRIEIGYFGSFYPNRGAGSILDALQSVSQEVRDKVRINIYTANVDTVKSEITATDLGESVNVRAQLPYLEFLREAQAMDCLLITDAETAKTGHRINPYLPSKLSDYVATGTPIWALYEPGSVLSRHNLQLMDRAGDLHQIVNTLIGLAK